jgi:hypothetical protein
MVGVMKKMMEEQKVKENMQKYIPKFDAKKFTE